MARKTAESAEAARHAQFKDRTRTPLLAYRTQRKERETLTKYVDEMTDLLGLGRLGGVFITTSRKGAPLGIFSDGIGVSADLTGQDEGSSTQYIGVQRKLVEGGVTPKTIDTTNHEIGHYLEYTALQEASESTLQALTAAYIDDFLSLRDTNNPELKEQLERIKRLGSPLTPYALFELLGGPASVTSALESLDSGGVISGTLGASYARSFSEWHAQRTARVLAELGARENTQPGNTLERYFKGITDKLRQLFDAFKNHPLGSLSSDQVFEDYIRGVIETASERDPFPYVAIPLQDRSDIPTFNSPSTSQLTRSRSFTPGNIDFIQRGQEARALDNEGTRFFVAPPSDRQGSGTPSTSLLSSNVTSSPDFTLPSVSDITARMNTFRKANGIKIKPTVINSSDIPSNVIRDRDNTSPGARIIGYTTPEGDSFIVADNVRNQRELEQAIFDETFHAGLPKVLGTRYTRELRRVVKNLGEIPGLLKFAERFDPDFQDRYRGLIAAVQRNPRDTTARFQLVEEVLNSSLGHPDAQRVLRQPVERIGQLLKDFIRKGFPSFRENTVSDYELFRLARKATQADGSARFNAPEPTTRFFLGAVGSTAFVRDEDGTVRGIGKDGAHTLPPFGRTELETARTTANQLADYVTTGRGQGRFRKLIRESDLWLGARNILYDTQSAAKDFDRDIERTESGFIDRAFNAIASAEDYLADRPLLQELVDTTVDTFVALQPGANLSTYKERAKDRVLRHRLENGETLYEREKALEEGLRVLRQQMGLRVSEKEMVASANSYIVAYHTKDRNEKMWYRNAAREQMTASDKKTHEAMVADLDQNPEGWADVVAFVDERAERPDDFVASGYTDEQAQAVLDELRASPQAAAYEAVREAVFGIRDAANEINQLNGRWNDSLQNRVDALDWQDTYVPLQGQAELQNQGIDSLYDSALDAEYNIVTGRESFPDALGATVAKAQKAYEYWAANEVAGKVAMNVAAYEQSPEYQANDRRKVFNGKTKEYGVNTPAFKRLMGRADPSRVIYFNPDNINLPRDEQTALVVNLNTQNGITAIKGKRDATADNIEKGLRKVKVPQITSLMSSLKTYRNIAFLPVDFTRNTLTGAYNIGQDQDFDAIAEYTHELTQPGYFTTLRRFTKLLADRDIGALEAYIEEEGPNSLAAQVSEFLELGGRSNILDSIRLDPLDGVAGVKVSNQTLRKAEEFFEAWNGVTDLMGRFGYYQVKKQRGVPPEIAASDALNLANFGARGTWSGPLGGLYGFFRSTVSGSVGQIDKGLNGQNTGPMMVAGAGLGAALMYGALLMSGDNEEDENIVEAMNGKRFIRDFSFNLGGQDWRLPLGHGPIAVAIAGGQQLVRGAMGLQSLTQTADNILTAGKDNASVLPTSGIGILSNPTAFLLDTMIPTAVRPNYQILTNLNGLGFPVFTGKPDDTYAARTGTRGGLSEDLSIWLREGVGSVPGFDGIGMNPDVLDHLMGQYLGTLWQTSKAGYELTEEFTDPNHQFSPREGLYPLQAFFGPERFTQAGEDFYRTRDFLLERKALIKDAEKANRPKDYLDGLRDDPEYKRALPFIERAEKAIKKIDETYTERIWDTVSSPSKQEKAYRDAWRGRYSTWVDFNNQMRRLNLYQ